MASFSRASVFVKNKFVECIAESLNNPNSLILQAFNSIALYYNDFENTFYDKVEGFYTKALVGNANGEIDQEKTQKRFDKQIAEYIRTNKIISSKFNKDLLANPILKFYASLRTLKDSRYNSLLKNLNIFDPKDRILNLSYGLHFVNQNGHTVAYYSGVYDTHRKAVVSNSITKLYTNRIFFIALFNTFIKPILPTISTYCTDGDINNNESNLDNTSTPLISNNSLIEFLLSAIDYEYLNLEEHMEPSEYEKYIEHVTDNEIKILKILKEHTNCSQAQDRIDHILIKKYLVKKDLDHAKEIFNSHLKDDQHSLLNLCSSILIAEAEKNYAQIETLINNEFDSLDQKTAEELYVISPIFYRFKVIRYEHKYDLNIDFDKLNSMIIPIGLYTIYKYEAMLQDHKSHIPYYISTILSRDEIKKICTQDSYKECFKLISSLIIQSKYKQELSFIDMAFTIFFPILNKAQTDNLREHRFSEMSYTLYNFFSEFIHLYHNKPPLPVGDVETISSSYGYDLDY